MQVDVFVGKGGLICVVKHGETDKLPQSQGPWGKEKELDISADDEARAGLDTQACLDDLTEKGFHIAQTRLRM